MIELVLFISRLCAAVVVCWYKEALAHPDRTEMRAKAGYLVEMVVTYCVREWCDCGFDKRELPAELPRAIVRR